MKEKTVKTEKDKWVMELEDANVGDAVTIGEIKRGYDRDVFGDRYTFYEVSVKGDYLGTAENLSDAKDLARSNFFDELKNIEFI